MRPRTHAERLRAMLTCALALGAVPGCHDATSPTGIGEPLRVQGAVFHPGELPGAPPPDEDAAADAGAPPDPAVTAVESAGAVVTLRQVGKVITGRASTDAYAVALQLAGQGSGYWVLPVGGPDPGANNELSWQATLDFGDAIPLGLRALRVVAVDGDGGAGRQVEVPLCVESTVPDNLNACVPSRAPPAAVITLSWDTEVDLNLVVLTPEGKTVNWQHPSTAIADGGVVDRDAFSAAGVGVLDRNSNADCAIDSVRRESLVFQTEPEPGTYRVYASLFNACGQSAVHFSVRALRRVPTGDDAGTTRLEETARRDGVALGASANAGADNGLFVMEVAYP